MSQDPPSPPPEEQPSEDQPPASAVVYTTIARVMREIYDEDGKLIQIQEEDISTA